MDEVHGLFPIPLMHVRPAIEPPLVAALVEHFTAHADLDNKSSPNLTHTAMLHPGDSPLLVAAAAAILPKLTEFGRLLFGEPLGWAIKEMWVNLMDTGGQQAMHNHANCFISGVLYLTPTHEDARTAFMRNLGGVDFAFRNDHDGIERGTYNASTWVCPAPEVGDMVLFPSYLMHGVAANKGGRRITMAFNAIPTQLNNWGYTVSFGA